MTYDVDDKFDRAAFYNVVISEAKPAEMADIRTQAAANSEDQFLESPDLQKATISALIESATNFDAMKDDILGDSQMVARFTKIIGQLAYAIIQNPSKAA
jgi:hypothetical protein